MLTLNAAGLLDVDAGEIIRPGILKTSDDRIVGVGGEIPAESGSSVAIDLGDSILHPG